MLRSRFAKIIKDEVYRKKLFTFMMLICILGYIWILSIGKVGTEIGVNDLGLKGNKREPLPISSGIMNFLYKTIDEKLENLDPSLKWEVLLEILQKDLKSESYIVPYTDSESGYEGKNLISYIRSPKGMGNQ